MGSGRSTEIAIVGSGIAGICVAYYLCVRHKRSSVTLIDSRQPMSFTSAQSGDNYRNWWPHPVMASFSNHSIDLMDALARETSAAFSMTRRGYVLATRHLDIDDLITDINIGMGELDDGQVRFHTEPNSNTYQPTRQEHGSAAPTGVDILSNQTLIRKTFPSFSDDIANLIHVRRGGDFSSQQLAQHMLERVRASGARRLAGTVTNIRRSGRFELQVMTEDGAEALHADVVVNAAGPFAGEIAAMLGVSLPIKNIFQQKLAFDDSLRAIPRHLPFSIDLDEQLLEWTEDEQRMLKEDASLAWLARPIRGGVHCRPDGGPDGSWVKLGWAYNTSVSEPQHDLANEPYKNDFFPEIVMRGAMALSPSLRPYLQAMPTRRSHYGGYYTLTEENWPLIGPTEVDGLYVITALSGFGSMAACAAGSICADWVMGARQPDFAERLSIARFDDAALMAEISASENKGLL